MALALFQGSVEGQPHITLGRGVEGGGKRGNEEQAERRRGRGGGRVTRNPSREPRIRFRRSPSDSGRLRWICENNYTITRRREGGGWGGGHVPRRHVPVCRRSW